MEVGSHPITRQEATAMRRSRQESVHEQVGSLRRQFLQDGDLPFTAVLLTEEVIAQALATLSGWLDRVFSPLVTLWVFLGQVLSADHPCRAAVARLLAHRLKRGQRRCSAQTGAYCQPRKRLPETFFADVARSVGRALDERARRRWPWQGRRVYLFDGTTVTMPDTPENQAAYPQVYNQGPGLGSPMPRVRHRRAGKVERGQVLAALEVGKPRVANLRRTQVELRQSRQVHPLQRRQARQRGALRSPGRATAREHAQRVEGSYW